MAEYSSKEKSKLAQKLKSIGITNEKDILNVRVSELKKITDTGGTSSLTLKDIKILWLMQEAIENKTLLDFFTNIE